MKAIGGGGGDAAPVRSIGFETEVEADTPFQNQSTTRAFTVTTTAPGYWRTDAYTECDGRWIHLGQETPYTHTPKIMTGHGKGNTKISRRRIRRLCLRAHTSRDGCVCLTQEKSR